MKTLVCLALCFVLSTCLGAEKIENTEQNYRPRPRGYLNERCSITQDCGTHGYLCAYWNRSCQCLDQYLADYETNNCLGGVDQRCKYDEHCIEGAFCMNQKTCQCKDRHPIVSRDGMKCSGSSSSNIPRFLLLATLYLIYDLST